MKLRIMVEVTHQGKTDRKMKTIEVPEKTVKLHSMMCEDVSDLRSSIASDVLANAVSAVAGPAAQKLDPMAMTSGPPAPGKPKTAADKKLNEMLGLDLLEHIDKVDGRAPMGKAPGQGMSQPPRQAGPGFDHRPPPGGHRR